jgi:hypothetical protein
METEGHEMKRTAGWLIIIVLFLLLANVAATVEFGGEPSYDPARLAREQAALQNELYWGPIWAAVWNLAGALIVLGVPALLLGAGGVAVWRFLEERTPDAAGRLPVLRSELATAGPASLGAFHETQRTSASRQAVPHSVTYAPHAHSDYRATGIGGSGVLEPPALALPSVTDFADIGHAPTMQSILLGLGAGGERITVPVKSLWHIALAGPTGNGKSNIARLVVAQLQALGAQVCVGDPKWTEYDAEQDEDWRPIAARLARDPAYKAGDIAALLGWAVGELERRLELRRAQQRLGPPIFLYLDELPWIASHVKDAEASIGELVRVGRGVGLFLLVGAQDMLAKSVSLSAERDNFRTGFYLGGDRKTGSVLLGLPQRDVSDPQGVGVAWLRSAATTPPQLVRVPYASNRAVRSLLATAPRRTTPAPRPHHEAEAVVRPLPSALNERQRALLAAMARATGTNEILHQVYGVDTGRRGADYKAGVEALRNDQAAIARAMGVQG